MTRSVGISIVAGLIGCSPNSIEKGATCSSHDDCTIEAPFCLEANDNNWFYGRSVNCVGCCNPCLRQCGLYAETCDEQPIESFPSFEQARIEQMAMPCGGFGYDYVVAGECSNGHLFIFGGSGEGNRLDLYDGDTLVFIGVRELTDGRDAFCHGVSYWPSAIECLDPEVAEVLCGTHGGDQLLFPELPQP